MRKVLFAAVAATSILSGCATTPGQPPPDYVQQIQDTARVACGFLPLAETVIEIVAAGVPGLSTATAVANAICTAVTSRQVQRGVRAPMVAGVVVRGQFVKR